MGIERKIKKNKKKSNSGSRKVRRDGDTEIRTRTCQVQERQVSQEKKILNEKPKRRSKRAKSIIDRVQPRSERAPLSPTEAVVAAASEPAISQAFDIEVLGL